MVELSPIEKRRQKIAAKLAKKQAKAEKKAARKAAKAAAAAIEPLTLADTLATAPGLAASLDAEQPQAGAGAELQQSDTLSSRSDTSALAAATPDSLASDSTAALKPVIPPDTTKIGFVFATGKVRAFRKDIQMRCDSLIYSDLDSIARLFKEPIIWNAGNRQYTADSVLMMIKQSRLDKANLSSNAFVIIKEDTAFYDQIRGAEIMAYFDSLGTLERFDALGGASAVFYIEENGALATANKVETKMLSALLDSGQVSKIFYFDSPKNNAYPTMQLPKDDKQMKGFKWNPDDRPRGRYDITQLVLNESERTSYAGRSRPNFVYTKFYFPDYIEGIEEEIAYRKAHKNDPRPKAPADTREQILPADTLSKTASAADTLKSSAATTPSSAADTLKSKADTLAAAQDTLKAASDSLLIPRDKWEERMLKRMARQEAREAKWAELDARDAAKAAAKQEKALAKKRVQTLKQLKAAEKEAAKDQKKLDRYIKRYQKKLAKQLQRKGEEYSE